MSRSSTDGSPSTQDYYDSWMALYAMVRQGKSFSGHERDCFFLNLGAGRFADVSSVSGLDFDDDGRGIATVDWDADGREDYWVSNRSGPRLRLLRNAIPSENDWLSLRLEGTQANRDAIGARVEIERGVAGGKKRIETLRAGEAFLSQSSRWMHFGLGKDAGASAAVVRWPGGAVERFEGIAPDGRYVLVQGSGLARPWSPPGERATLAPSKQVAPELPAGTRVVLAARFPLPEIPYLDADGVTTHRLQERMGKGPLLVNLWASWCANCVAELKALSPRQDELARAGLDVLTISVDEPEDRAKATALLDGMGARFPRAFSQEKTAQVFEFLPRLVVDIQPGLALPTSFLLDEQGRLAVIYRGPVEADTLLADVALLKQYGEEQRAIATPYAGRWVGDPSGPRYMAIVRRLRAIGEIEVAAEYLSKVKVGASFDPETNPSVALELARTRSDLAEDLLAAGKLEPALELLAGAVEVQPKDARLSANYASNLARAGRLDEAVAAYQRTLALAPESAGLYQELGTLHLRRRDAAAAMGAFEDALRLNPELSLSHQNLGILLAQKGDLTRAEAEMRLAVEKGPENYEALRNLALLLQQTGRDADAIPLYERVLAHAPDDAEACFNLAVAQHRAGSKDEAQRLLVRLRTLSPPLAERLAGVLAP